MGNEYDARVICSAAKIYQLVLVLLTEITILNAIFEKVA
jgi:hypothetical protein